MSWEDAIRSATDGIVIDFEASPGSKETKVPAGYNHWRRRLEVRLKSQPERGKANEELIEALAVLFKVPSISIEIAAGATTARKSVKIRGVKREEAIKTLGRYLNERL